MCLSMADEHCAAVVSTYEARHDVDIASRFLVQGHGLERYKLVHPLVSLQVSHAKVGEQSPDWQFRPV